MRCWFCAHICLGLLFQIFFKNIVTPTKMTRRIHKKIFSYMFQTVICFLKNVENVSSRVFFFVESRKDDKTGAKNPVRVN